MLVGFPESHQPQGFYQEPGSALGCTRRRLDELATKAGEPSPGRCPIKRNRFIAHGGGTRKVHRELEPMARALAPASILTGRTLSSA